MKFLLILLSTCGISLSLLKVDPLVSTNVGLIKGLRDESGYAKFLGVPYAKIDDNNIFGKALPHPDFEDIFEAYDDSKTCVQYHRDVLSGTRECLTMNIFIPESANSKNRLPVMVWIHGGAFISGSANGETTDPLSLLEHDVIYVAINYRLGVFGFMCLDIPEVPGNTGLKDQIMALRWINKNIEAFGGDSNQITIFGESAGGMSTNLHLFSSYEKLFQRAIIQSGPATSYWMMVESDNTVPLRLAERLGYNTSAIYEALSFLSKVDVHTIAVAAKDLMITDGDGDNQPITKPCVEKQFEGIENFLTEHPMNMKSTKASTSVIIGYNSREMAFQYATADAEYFETHDISLHFSLGFDMNNDMSKAIQDVKHFYLGDENISESVRWQMVDLGSDLIFNHPTQRMIHNLLDSGINILYHYVFSYSGSKTTTTMGMNKTWTGAAHGDELSYLFDKDTDGTEKTWEDKLVGNRLVELWTNFGKYGNPTPQLSELLPVRWTPVNKSTLPYLEINSELTIESRPFYSRMAFWDLFYKQYGQLQKWYKIDNLKRRNLRRTNK